VDYDSLSRKKTAAVNSDLTGNASDVKRVTFENDFQQENVPGISNVGAGLENSAAKPFFGKEAIRPFQSTVNALSLGGVGGGPGHTMQQKNSNLTEDYKQRFQRM
jgi:hypothetical protein